MATAWNVLWANCDELEVPGSPKRSTGYSVATANFIQRFILFSIIFNYVCYSIIKYIFDNIIIYIYMLYYNYIYAVVRGLLLFNTLLSGVQNWWNISNMLIKFEINADWMRLKYMFTRFLKNMVRTKTMIYFRKNLTENKWKEEY